MGNNYLLPNQVEALRRKLVKAIENRTPLEEVYHEFGQLSENQRKELSAGCIDAILCRHTTLDLIDQSNQLARNFTSFIGSFFSQLPDEEQGRFVEFIIDENVKSAFLLTEKIGFTEALVAQLVNDYINNIGSLNKKVSPKVRDFAKKTTKYNPNSNSINNMKEFFYKDGFGSDLGKIVSKTSKQYHGQSIYEVNKNGLGFKKGDQIYLDGMHRDHFEVFDKKGNFKGVYNLDGTLNESKTKSGQNIKLIK